MASTKDKIKKKKLAIKKYSTLESDFLNIMLQHSIETLEEIREEEDPYLTISTPFLKDILSCYISLYERIQEVDLLSANSPISKHFSVH